ncbi:MAG: B12-binding domain-containing radical SAM protein, partial [Pirellulales bacterium]
FVAGRLQPRYTQSPELKLAGYPLPERGVLPRRRYLTADVFEATRGCTHNCSFCVVPAAWGRKPFQKPVDEVVADIRRQQARRAIFIDLNLIADKHYATALCEALTPLKIHWYGLATTLLCDDLPLLDLFAESGCRGLLMGLESLSARNLDDNHKAFNHPENYLQVVDRLHQRGIALQGCFVFGLDDDTPDTFLRTAEFAVEAGIDLPRFAIVTPFPGTDLYYRLQQEGRLLTRNWELYDGQHVVFEPARMTVQELERGTEAAWKYAYRWTSIARRLRRCPGPLALALATNLGYRYYAQRLHKFYTCDAMLPCPPPRAGRVKTPATSSVMVFDKQNR